MMIGIGIPSSHKRIGMVRLLSGTVFVNGACAAEPS